VETVVETHAELRDTDGFLVESPEGDLGWVEEVWLSETGEPKALAVRTADGRHGLLLERDVVSVDRERRWVVVPEKPKLLELDVPRVAGGDGAPLAASWATTGANLDVTPRPHRLWHVPYRPAEPKPARRRRKDRPVWQGIALLLVTIAFLVGFTTALAFIIADLVT
jgi:hypothetical protein